MFFVYFQADKRVGKRLLFKFLGLRIKVIVIGFLEDCEHVLSCWHVLACLHRDHCQQFKSLNLEWEVFQIV